MQRSQISTELLGPAGYWVGRDNEGPLDARTEELHCTSAGLCRVLGT